jgi:hypothetical protein
VYPIDTTNQFVASLISVPTPQPTFPESATNTTPQPTDDLNLTPVPTMSQPTAQPVLPLSFNLISDQPVLFVIILFAVVLSVTLAVWSAKKPKDTSAFKDSASIPAVSSDAAVSANEVSEDPKYCIHCGIKNKSYAAFCEQCGKQIP